MTRIYTEAEIFEAVCYAVGDDGNKAIEKHMVKSRTMNMQNADRILTKLLLR